jgi:hypothetical protein
MTTSETPARSDDIDAARRIAWRLRIYGLPLVIWASALGVPPLFAVLFLALFPWLLAVIAALYAPETRPRPAVLLADTGLLLVAAGAGVAWRSLSDLRMVDPGQALLPGAAFGFALALAVLVSFRKAGAAAPTAFAVALLASIPYGFGAASVANAVLDSAPVQGFDTRVLDKRSGDFGAASRELLMRAWGPVSEDRWEGHLPIGMWQNVMPTSRVCVALHGGALRMEWYQFRPCLKERKECTKDPDCAAWLEAMRAALADPDIGKRPMPR